MKYKKIESFKHLKELCQDKECENINNEKTY